jgi:hypothetical protein
MTNSNFPSGISQRSRKIKAYLIRSRKRRMQWLRRRKISNTSLTMNPKKRSSIRRALDRRSLVRLS